MNLVFEWDETKARSNLRKHKVSFEEAKTVFNDLFVVTFSDDIHSVSEGRYISIGVSASNRHLLVIHTALETGNNTLRIRIISCRKATAMERRAYEQGSD